MSKKPSGEGIGVQEEGVAQKRSQGEDELLLKKDSEFDEEEGEEEEEEVVTKVSTILPIALCIDV